MPPCGRRALYRASVAQAERVAKERIQAEEKRATEDAKAKLDDARSKRAEADGKRATADRVEELADVEKKSRQTARARKS